jgi:hypothetical protein
MKSYVGRLLLLLKDTSEIRQDGLISRLSGFVVTFILAVDHFTVFESPFHRFRLELFT